MSADLLRERAQRVCDLYTAEHVQANDAEFEGAVHALDDALFANLLVQAPAADVVEAVVKDLRHLRARLGNVRRQLQASDFDGMRRLGEYVHANGQKLDELTAIISTFTSDRAGIPAGWKLTPEVATEEMLDQGQHVNSEWLNDNAPLGERMYREPAKAVYAAMLSAAPSPPEGGS